MKTTRLHHTSYACRVQDADAVGSPLAYEQHLLTGVTWLSRVARFDETSYRGGVSHEHEEVTTTYVGTCRNSFSARFYLQGLIPARVIISRWNIRQFSSHFTTYYAV